jgi:hypothetical protein
MKCEICAEARILEQIRSGLSLRHIILFFSACLKKRPEDDSYQSGYDPEYFKAFDDIGRNWSGFSLTFENLDNVENKPCQ